MRNVSPIEIIYLRRKGLKRRGELIGDSKGTVKEREKQKQYDIHGTLFDNKRSIQKIISYQNNGDRKE